ncbi:MAG: sugar ABC transporter ATP-binding protein [Trueperaceae bacterium]|nr:MAG: sugar ABC transporter ATP-binding protein [Trueperaceae bacterium]
MPPQSGFVLDVQGVSKRFPGVQALSDVSLQVRPGSVHALVGENGAGKSTLMKILIGWHRRDRGEIALKGQPVDFHEPKQALNAGISIIQQELSAIGDMSIAENLFLGREPRRAGAFIDYPGMNALAKRAMAELELELDPWRKMKSLSVAQMQLVEIAKAISHEADIIIMDEPTSALGDREIEHLMASIRKLKARGTGIIYISHKLEEVFEIADEVTVLRDGHHIASMPTGETDRDGLIRLMIGREAKGFPKTNTPTTRPLLEVEQLTREGEFRDVSFTLHEGEILGVFGLMGAGKSELLNALFSVTRATSGSVTFRGKRLRARYPSQAMRNNMALITEDRKATGLILPMSVRDNMAISTLGRHTRFGFVSALGVGRVVSSMSQDLDVRMASPRQLVKFLSGGNQQKVVLGRWLLTKPSLLMLDEPTRGIDIGAKAEIYRFMSEFVDQGKGIVLASSELPEVLGMSDRILVMKAGRMAGILTREQASEEAVMQLAV